MSVSVEPSVSIIIPAYNEEKNIETVIGGFLASGYSNILEILVVDGNSTDSTAAKVADLSCLYSKVKLLHNPFRIQSAALNIGLEACQGDIFLRADAHCHYAPDYVEKCIHTLLTTKAINVGGAQRFVAEDKFQAGVALAANSLLGNGGAKYRNPQYNGYVDTVFLGCMWSKTLINLRGYSNQITNEDAELNQRLLEKDSEAIYVSSDIKVWYYPRRTWLSLWIQYFKYGRGRFLTTIKHTKNIQLRGKLPFLFVSCMIIWFGLDLFLFQINLYAKELFLLGLVAVFTESLRVNLKLNGNFAKEVWRGNGKSPPSLFSRWLMCGIVIMTLPVAHFSGYAYQLFRNKFLKISDW
ncbi:glycosyltransferase family 2 protein [Waterburya agarophytonicola K14]|uniref:Glycosyltransferase family 2 protein n=1 Tax=Waterburya agarophytonicola KI4 TaxID=2874699 RepID=A0A964FHT3_9CYAN|nr:glycosyltransferase family 2 protein [Waterburya agarophytonicola]MCC0179337.1 glycosyltransferase family 2 protein [Waterburya agarophytonicola KI4]